MSRAHRLCRIDEIPEQGSRGFSYEGDSIFAVKKSGKIYMYRNQCPHINVALEWVEDQFLDSTRSMILCSNHGALFLIDNGKCVAGPCSGKSLQAIPFEIIEDDIYLRMLS